VRWLARLVAVLVVGCGLVPVLAGQSWACSCVQQPPDQQRYRQAAHDAAVIYVGRVLSESHVDGEYGGEYHYQVAVDETLKGGPAATETLHTSDNGGTCGTRLENGEILVVDRAGDGSVGICGDTTQEKVTERAAIVRDELHGSPAPTPSPRPPAPSPSASASASPSGAPKPSPSAAEPPPSPSPSPVLLSPPSEDPVPPPPSETADPTPRATGPSPVLLVGGGDAGGGLPVVPVASAGGAGLLVAGAVVATRRRRRRDASPA
jgi:hypothetical protein